MEAEGTDGVQFMKSHLFPMELLDFITDHCQPGSRQMRLLMKRGLATDFELLPFREKYPFQNVDISFIEDDKAKTVGYGPHLRGKFHGISIVFDNINKRVLRHEYSSKQKVKDINMVSAIVCFNRISLPVEAVVKSQPPVSSMSLPLETFLVSEEDMALLERDMVKEVMKVLKTHLEFFKSATLERDSHTFSKESALKSDYVSEPYTGLHS